MPDIPDKGDSSDSGGERPHRLHCSSDHRHRGRRAQKVGARSGGRRTLVPVIRWRWCAWTSSTRCRASVRGTRGRHGGTQRPSRTMFAREFPRVARTVHHVVGDRARAEEVTQDAFLELLRHWGKVGGYDRPRPVGAPRGHPQGPARAAAGPGGVAELRAVDRPSPRQPRAADAGARGAGRRPPTRAQAACRGRCSSTSRTGRWPRSPRSWAARSRLGWSQLHTARRHLAAGAQPRR